mmetsp:Transcript_501/g.1268  ORF Transcript_501/g.1268 Transcript_501/m.1268 type:complete len:342 (-) Transcript_501:1015-2040(-)
MGSGGGAGGMADIFDMFMGGGGGRGRREREKKSEDVVHKLSASLVELYSGATKKLSLSRNLQCSGCKGAGTKSGKKYECTTCKGTGVQVMIRPLGPGMVQQIQQRCSNCSGSGSMVPPSDVCGTCKGKGLVAEKKTFEVTIEPGMKQGSKITLRGEAGCSEPGLQPGDVILMVQQKDHDYFKRVNVDLIMEKKITLTEALCGSAVHIQHLDGRVLRIANPPGEVIKPDTFKCIADEGMPFHGRPFQKGNLYIHFQVVFPDRLDPKMVPALQQALPLQHLDNGLSMDVDDVDGTHEVHKLKSVPDIESELRSRQKLGREANAYDSDDDDDMPRGQRVQCAQS